MKTAVGIIWYNDPSILRLIPQLNTDYVFVIDGKFPWNDCGKDNYSNKDLLGGFTGKNLIITDCPKDEVTKRNEYLKQCEVFNITYLIVMDSEEYLIEYDWDAFWNDVKDLPTGIYGIPFCRNYPQESFTAMAKLIVNPKEFEYYKCHTLIKHRPTNRIIDLNSIELMISTNLHITTDDKLRSKTYLEELEAYHSKLRPYETQIKRELGF